MNGTASAFAVLLCIACGASDPEPIEPAPVEPAPVEPAPVETTTRPVEQACPSGHIPDGEGGCLAPHDRSRPPCNAAEDQCCASNGTIVRPCGPIGDGTTDCSDST